MQVNKTPLRVAVVGHTNTGKTSLLRTLTRDRSFGEVDDAPGTTRQVRSAPVTLNQTVVLVWYWLTSAPRLSLSRNTEYWLR